MGKYPPIEDDEKQRAWEAFVAGWKQRIGDDFKEDSIEQRTARGKFEEWYG